MTQEKNHTPGPWKILNLSPKRGSISIGKSENSGSFCEIYTTGNGDEKVQQANARLIATVPELLELAEALLGFEIGTPRDYKKRGAASFSPLCKHIIDLQNKARTVIAKATNNE